MAGSGKDARGDILAGLGSWHGLCSFLDASR